MPNPNQLMTKDEWDFFRPKLQSVSTNFTLDKVFHEFVQKAGLKRRPRKKFEEDWHRIVKAQSTPQARSYTTLKRNKEAFCAVVEKLSADSQLKSTHSGERQVYTVFGPDGRHYTGVGDDRRVKRFEGVTELVTTVTPPPTGCGGHKCWEGAVQRLGQRMKLTNRGMSRICETCDDSWFPRFVEAVNDFGSELTGNWTPQQFNDFQKKFLSDESGS